MKISVLKIVEDTTVDGPGFRTSIYCAGCVNECVGCHNPESWDIANGEMMNTEDILARVVSNPFADVTFSGGDPMYQPKAFAELAKMIKENTRKSIWCYTGYTFEYLSKRPECVDLLKNVDVLVDGKFVQSLKDEKLLFRGSRNQRLVDVQASLKSGTTILLDDYDKKTLSI